MMLCSFLNDLERVTKLQYMPTDGESFPTKNLFPLPPSHHHPLPDDVLKARLKTVGVSEYKFEMEVAAGRESAAEWRIVDVGGSRSQVSVSFCGWGECLCFFWAET
jgi:guanine nucleotide-binding protein alpha-1 subunit